MKSTRNVKAAPTGGPSGPAFGDPADRRRRPSQRGRRGQPCALPPGRLFLSGLQPARV